MSSTKLRLALFGSGRIGQVHARNIADHPELELVLIADPFIDGARALASRTAGRAVQDPDEVFADSTLDGVVIASPTPTHVDLMSTAAAHGLAVLCEKPIDLDIDTVLDCRERIKEHAVPIMLGFNRRFDPHFASVRTQVAAGAIGALEQLLITSRDPAPAPRDYIAASGGIFRDMTIHDLDMARFFLPNIVEVSAMGTNSFHDDTKALGDFDAATIILRGRDGEIVNITNSRHCAFGYDQRLEAFGSTGMLTAGNVAPTTVRRYGSNGTEEAPAYFPFFLERYAQAYRAELDAFALSIRTGDPCSPGFDDGVAALVLANAAAESAATGKTVAITD
ncbi:inositol 2-dehydrogenase [Rhodococcus sp. ACS1]|uniref:inositol 2-dehydrogenase n=1 Tax=Rhodococcus sp. ACS1 TaxID=2028570 RepID=UPI000BB100EA|nr:inositol 2-dehydrogenase [Rhodococcus sp. ACS1]PBC46945.1 inositol 2-dehydrogenase [Rhodococcus sp. ACS1]